MISPSMHGGVGSAEGGGAGGGASEAEATGAGTAVADAGGDAAAETELEGPTAGDGSRAGGELATDAEAQASGDAAPQRVIASSSSRTQRRDIGDLRFTTRQSLPRRNRIRRPRIWPSLPRQSLDPALRSAT
jgi:hypothetical protein